MHTGSNPESIKGSEGHLENYFRNSMNMVDQASEDSSAYIDAPDSGVFEGVCVPDE